MNELPDDALIQSALEGSKDALRQLVERHQPFVYNVALKMYGHHESAEDLTQEVFVKVITSLQTFRGQSAFRTWLYRIALTHFLKSKRRGLEVLSPTFQSYFETIAAVPDEALTVEPALQAGAIEELRLRCTTGMLMCLDRDQRLTFILGELFGIDHKLGGELLDISPGNFRVRLTRARKDLSSWMQRRCGLVNEANPCRCHKKAQGYIREGHVDPRRLLFNADYAVRIADVARRDSSEVLTEVERVQQRVFSSHPLQLSRSRVVDELLKNETISSFFGVQLTAN